MRIASFVHRHITSIVVIGTIILSIILWLPGLFSYIPWNDTAIYGLLGEDFWKHGTYTLFGEPNARHLPLHAIVSYPFVSVFSYQFGMALSSLCAGILVLIASFLLLQESFSQKVALIAVPLIAIHHGFVLMTMQGSADLLFAALFLMSVWCYVRAGMNPRWYIGAGLLLGLACLTRYNGAPVFALFGLYTIWKRPSHLRSPSFWIGMIIGAGLFSLWFLRNYLTFGNPLHSGYIGELSEQSLGFFAQIRSNVWYYLNPLQNILLLFPFAAIGVYHNAKRQHLLLLAILSVLALTMIWWVQGMRFAFPAYPILIGFAVTGIVFVSWRSSLLIAIISIVAIAHVSALCFYSYGQCNAWLDTQTTVIPDDLGLSPERMWSWNYAIDYINVNAESGAMVVVDTNWNAAVWDESVFRDDLVVIDEYAFADMPRCPVYQFFSNYLEGSTEVFHSPVSPKTVVRYTACPTN